MSATGELLKDTLSEWTQRAAWAGALAGALATTAACTTAEQSDNAGSTTAAPSRSAVPACENRNQQPDDSTNVPQLQIDYLGGGYCDVFSYAGPGMTVEDQRTQNTYYTGDFVPVECYVPDGREVSSDPEAGEENRSSTVWFKLLRAEQEWTTAVYTANAEEVQAESEQCRPDQIPYFG